MIDQATVLQRYKDGIGRSGQKWLDGIMGMTVNPAQKAASPQGMANWLSGVQQSVAKRQANLSKVTLQQIQSAARDYGMGNYTNSSTKAGNKWAAKLPGMMSLWAAQRSAVAGIQRVPGTNNQARWAAAVNLAIAAKGKI